MAVAAWLDWLKAKHASYLPKCFAASLKQVIEDKQRGHQSQFCHMPISENFGFVHSREYLGQLLRPKYKAVANTIADAPKSFSVELL